MERNSFWGRTIFSANLLLGVYCSEIQQHHTPADQDEHDAQHEKQQSDDNFNKFYQAHYKQASPNNFKKLTIFIRSLLIEEIELS